jgi:hypothetical protein
VNQSVLPALMPVPLKFEAFVTPQPLGLPASLPPSPERAATAEAKASFFSGFGSEE